MKTAALDISFEPRLFDFTVMSVSGLSGEVAVTFSPLRLREARVFLICVLALILQILIEYLAFLTRILLDLVRNYCGC